MSDLDYQPDYAIPPGEYLEEVLEDRGFIKGEFARSIGMSVPQVKELFIGKKQITTELAMKLEKKTDVPAHVWTGLEKQYRMALKGNCERRHHERKARTA